MPHSVARCATRWSQIEVLKYLVESHVDVLAERGLLQWAARFGHVDMTEFLLDHGAEVHAYGTGHTALAVAAAFENFEVVKLLLKRGADVNLIGLGDSSLFYALTYGYRDIAQFLIENGAHRTRKRSSAMFTAAKYGRVEALRLLLKKGADIDATGDLDQATALCGASLGGHYEAVQFLINAGASLDGAPHYGTTPLIEASREDAATCDLLDLLIEAGANVNMCRPFEHPNVISNGKEEYTALSAACFVPYTAHQTSVLRVARVKTLREAGADCNLGSPTPLSQALESGNIDLARVLLEAGASAQLLPNRYEKILQSVTEGLKCPGDLAVITGFDALPCFAGSPSI